MLRQDGFFTFYRVQHRYRGGGEWTYSNIGNFLFNGLSFRDAQGELGDRYRALINEAEHAVWQAIGVDGAWTARAARQVCEAIEERPENAAHCFRVVEVTIAQRTVAL